MARISEWSRAPARLGGWVIRVLRLLINWTGFDVVRYKGRGELAVPPDIDDEDAQTIREVRSYTMTSPERIHALCAAVRYVVSAGIPGAIVECGVWRGGSMMAVAKTLLRAGCVDRDLYLFDTFEGMTPPGKQDVAIDGDRAEDLMKQSLRSEQDLFWCYAPLEAVRQALNATGYPSERLHFVAGKVEDTIPQAAPPAIALLRLDTDWYESTRHELHHLVPRLGRGGVLIIDDYGHWQGARMAVDEYLAKSDVKLLLNRVDYTGRIAVKVFE